MIINMQDSEKTIINGRDAKTGQFVRDNKAAVDHSVIPKHIKNYCMRLALDVLEDQKYRDNFVAKSKKDPLRSFDSIVKLFREAITVTDNRVQVAISAEKIDIKSISDAKDIIAKLNQAEQ